MAIVNDAKLEALASFIVNNEVNGNCACCSVLDQMPEEMQKEVNAPCKGPNYEDEWCYDCPFYAKDAFLFWIEEPKRTIHVEDLEKPKQENFIEFDRFGDGHVNDFRYAKALEQYCNDLENVLADTEYDLESAECDNRELTNRLEQIRGALDGSH